MLRLPRAPPLLLLQPAPSAAPAGLLRPHVALTRLGSGCRSRAGLLRAGRARNLPRCCATAVQRRNQAINNTVVQM
jgi:hypothetical protein